LKQNPLTCKYAIISLVIIIATVCLSHRKHKHNIQPLYFLSKKNINYFLKMHVKQDFACECKEMVSPIGHIIKNIHLYCLKKTFTNQTQVCEKINRRVFDKPWRVYWGSAQKQVGVCILSFNSYHSMLSFFYYISLYIDLVLLIMMVIEWIEIGAHTLHTK
jgi:hypothetical protein